MQAEERRGSGPFPVVIYRYRRSEFEWKEVRPPGDSCCKRKIEERTFRKKEFKEESLSNRDCKPGRPYKLEKGPLKKVIKEIGRVAKSSSQEGVEKKLEPVRRKIKEAS